MGRVRALLLPCALAACGGSIDRPAAPVAPAAPAAALEGPGFVIPGEAMRFQLRFAGLPIGTIDLTVTADGRGTAAVWSHTRTTGIVAAIADLKEEVTTWIDLERGVPVFRRGTFAGLFLGLPSIPQGEPQPWTFGDGRNPHAAVAALRGWEVPSGSRAHFDLVVASSRTRVDVVQSRDLLETDDGRVPTIRIDGEVRGAAQDGGPLGFAMWFADDASRKLLRIDAETVLGGIMRLELIAYERPQR